MAAAVEGVRRRRADRAPVAVAGHRRPCSSRRSTSTASTACGGRYDYEYRPWVDPPAGFFAWTGALKIGRSRCPTGRSRPWSAPRCRSCCRGSCDHPAISAVVSTVMIGDHVGFPIVLLRRPGSARPRAGRRLGSPLVHRTCAPMDRRPASTAPRTTPRRTSTCGRGSSAGGCPGSSPATWASSCATGADGCPYLDLPGERRRRYVEGDDTWFA